VRLGWEIDDATFNLKVVDTLRKCGMKRGGLLFWEVGSKPQQKYCDGKVLRS
jgi:hypothetical protein